jgi:hypothetical protein
MEGNKSKEILSDASPGCIQSNVDVLSYVVMTWNSCACVYSTQMCLAPHYIARARPPVLGF